MSPAQGLLVDKPAGVTSHDVVAGIRRERGGKVGHAELAVGSGLIMLADEFPEMSARSPQTVGGSPVILHLYVDKVDDVVQRATEAGARVIRPVENAFYGDRTGMIADPFGHLWSVATHVEDVSPEEIERRAAKFCG